jgi:hypothetical protein
VYGDKHPGGLSLPLCEATTSSTGRSSQGKGKQEDGRYS